VSGEAEASGGPAGPSAVLVGIGNAYRRDDGIGPAVAMAVSELSPPDVAVVISDGEPAGLLEAWSGAQRAVLVDAVRGPAKAGTARPGPGGSNTVLPGTESVPGRMHRSVLVPPPIAATGTADDALAAASWAASGSASTHRMGVADAVRLAAAVQMLPERLVAFGVEITDIGFGPGLSPAVAAAVPDVVQAVLAELSGAWHGLTSPVSPPSRRWSPTAAPLRLQVPGERP
jgi:hydrogenase maturation protease